jgi:hypothetical protein
VHYVVNATLVWVPPESQLQLYMKNINTGAIAYYNNTAAGGLFWSETAETWPTVGSPLDGQAVKVQQILGDFTSSCSFAVWFNQPTTAGQVVPDPTTQRMDNLIITNDGNVDIAINGTVVPPFGTWLAPPSNNVLYDAGVDNGDQHSFLGGLLVVVLTP